MSYYQPSSPFAGARSNSRAEPLQRPPSGRFEQGQAYSPDAYSSPSQPTPAYPIPAQPARRWSPAPRGEPTTPIARPASGLSSHQAVELQVSVSVPRVFKTLLQWKEDARATTADYQRNGFPSPVAWVFILNHSISFSVYILCRSTSKATPSLRMLSLEVWIAGGHGTLPERSMRLDFRVSCIVASA